MQTDVDPDAAFPGKFDFCFSKAADIFIFVIHSIIIQHGDVAGKMCRLHSLNT